MLGVKLRQQAKPEPLCAANFFGYALQVSKPLCADSHCQNAPTLSIVALLESPTGSVGHICLDFGCKALVRHRAAIKLQKATLPVIAGLENEVAVGNDGNTLNATCGLNLDRIIVSLQVALRLPRLQGI